MNIKATIESEKLTKWINENIVFKPFREWMSCGNLIQICHATYKDGVIGSQRTYFPHNFLKDSTETNYGIGIQEKDLPKEFKGWYYYEQDPYADDKFWFETNNFEFYILAWMFAEQKELFNKFIQE